MFSCDCLVRRFLMGVDNEPLREDSTATAVVPKNKKSCWGTRDHQGGSDREHKDVRSKKRSIDGVEV